MIVVYDGKHLSCIHSLFQGNTKDIQQLFNAIDHRVEALRLNAQHSNSEISDQEKEAQSRVSHDGSSSSDDEDKESGQEDDVPSSPESTVETHTANIRQKVVSLPSDNSGCEAEGEGEGVVSEGGESKGRHDDRDSPDQQQENDSNQTSTVNVTN